MDGESSERRNKFNISGFIMILAAICTIISTMRPEIVHAYEYASNFIKMDIRKPVKLELFEKYNILLFEDEREKVEKYIIRSHKETISIRELESLTDGELYYLYNGIYAYCGMYFLEKELNEYYETFSWFVPEYDTTEFRWDYLNYYQRETINYIKSIENERTNSK